MTWLPRGTQVSPVADHWLPADNVAMMACLPLGDTQRRTLLEKDIALPHPNVDGREGAAARGEWRNACHSPQADTAGAVMSKQVNKMRSSQPRGSYKRNF